MVHKKSGGSTGRFCGVSVGEPRGAGANMAVPYLVARFGEPRGAGANMAVPYLVARWLEFYKEGNKWKQTRKKSGGGREAW